MNQKLLLVLLIVRLWMPCRAQEKTAKDNNSNPDLAIAFTGHLLGYYRLPEWQSADFEKLCPSSPPYDAGQEDPANSPSGNNATGPVTPAEMFLSLEDKSQVDLLLGMGDNFGVTLESRVYRQDREAGGQLLAKSRDLKGWPADAPSDQIGDNVGCFFSRAGYDAIVPGKDDFYFGPERLRRIADRLSHVPESNGLHPVRMLGANLIVKTGFLKKPSKIADSDKGLKFIPGTPTGVKSLDITDGGTIPPYARQIRFEISSTSPYAPEIAAAEGAAPALLKFQPFLCPVETSEGLDGLNPEACKQKDKDENNAVKAVALGEFRQEKRDKSDPSDKTVWDFDLPPALAAGRLPALYGLCAAIDSTDRIMQLPNDDQVYLDRGRKQQYYCLRFTVAQTFLGDGLTDPWIVKPLRRDTNIHCDAGEAPCPRLKPGFVAVFGVVDKDLTALIGRDNLSWRNEQHKVRPGQSNTNTVSPGKETYSTSVDTLDEATAIGLAMRSFCLMWKRTHGSDCGDVYKVLLAQMSRGKAETLAANLANTKISDTSLRFDVVISAAADFSAATANESVTFYRPLKPELPRPAHNAKAGETETKDDTPDFRQFVAVPWLGYDSENKRVPDPVRFLTVVDSGFKSQHFQERNFFVGGRYHTTFPMAEKVDKDKLQACYNVLGQHYLANKRRDYWRNQLPAPQKTDPTVEQLGCSSITGDEPATLPAAPGRENAFQLAVLAVLRDHTRADVAMLQKRSFYWGPFPQMLYGNLSLENPNGELLDRIMWMGDYLEVLSVKGSTLKKVLEESEKFDELDEQATNEIVETGRGLLALGLEKTRDKQYLIDGMQLDPNRLYTVATSNHIAAGDNGYPELADPQFADKHLPRVDKHDNDANDETPRISSVVCEELRGESCVANSGLVFASIQQLPPQLEPTTLSFIRAYERSVFGTPDLPRDAFSRTNYQAQLNRTWRISLKDLSFNLSAVRNNLTEPERLTELGGVTDPGAGNAKSHAINFSTHEEWVSSGKWVDAFIRGLAEYQDTVTGNTATVPIATPTGSLSNVLYPAPALRTYSKNQFALDPGIFWHQGWPWHPAGHKYFDKLGVVFEPAHFDTQIAAQDLVLAAVYNSTGTGALEIPAIVLGLPRTHNIFQRLGFRAESDKNHFEAGYQGGFERNALESLSTNIGTCPALIITLCLETQELQPGFLANSIRQTTGTRERHGPYMDLDWTWPLMWRLAFRTQDSFAYFGPAHLDNPIDTLYRNDLTETLSYQILPNLNIGPSLERFDYENKIERVHLRTWSPSIKLTYSFDVLEGSRRTKSLRYSPASSAAGEDDSE
jgi:hypothetical protein